MKFVTWAFIVLLCITALLIIGFKRISAEAAIYKPVFQQRYQTITASAKIGDIPLPAGFKHAVTQQGSFAEWLNNIYLRKNNIVHLYNGQPIEQQGLHYAVLDISTGDKDLQQCADAVMRLKAEYYFSRGEYGKISFPAGKNTFYNFNDFAKKQNCYTHDCLLKFMETVFINCGTYTVDEMTKPVDMTTVIAGDVFVKAGAPGHAMIVVAIAQNETGDKVYLLAQSYMPAQDMHIVINPVDAALSPWYKVTNDKTIVTPGWVLEKKQLKRWK